MKHFKLFFALFAMLALGVGNAWGEETLVKVSSTDLVDGDYLITATKSGSEYYLTATTFAAKKSSAAKLESDYSNLWSFTKQSDGTWSVKLSSGEGLGVTADNNGVVCSKTGGKPFTISATASGETTVYMVASDGTNNRYLTLYQTSNWRCYKTTTNANADQVRAIQLYKVTSSGSSEEPVLSVEPEEVAFGTKNIYFDSEKEGDLEIDITGQNLTGNVTATITEDDDNVFSLSSSSFAPNAGEVSEKLTVSYNVSEAKDYTATLILSSDGVDAIELPITLTTVNKKPTIYTKVTDAATLSAGDKVIFVYETDKKAAGAFPDGKGYLEAIDITQALHTSANPATASITDEAVVEYTLGGTTGAWELISGSNKLSEKTANSSSSVDLIADGDTKWSITISDGDATIRGTTNTIKYNTTSPRFKTYNSGQTAIQLYTISVPKYAVNFIQPEGGELIVKNGETAITNGNTFAEGIKLTVTATPANGYEGGTVVVKDAVGNDVTATVYADGVLTMPAYAVTISATFEKKECTLLATPTVSATTTYNSATLSWGAVINAAKYSVTVGETTTEVTEPTFTATGLTAETTYTYQVQAIAEAGQDTYCDSKVAEGTFTTATAPTATLTLKDIVGTTTLTGSLNGTITLPTEAAECSKTFVGWSAVEIPEPGEKPATNFYDSGAEYTLAAETQTLYAVYADAEAGENVTQTLTISGQTTATTYANKSFTDNKGQTWSGQCNIPDASHFGLRANDDNTHIASPVFSGNVKSVKAIIRNSSSSTRKVYLCSSNTTAKPSSGDLGGVTVDGSVTDVEHTFTISGAFNQFYMYTSGALQFNKIEVTYGSAPSYSNYSTTCTAAPKAEVNPTEVTTTAASVEGKVTVTYENVNTANVAIALYNDAACTETFTAGWLTASIDADKNIAYTVAENTTYAERKAYIKLTAPETTGATDPAVVVIPVTQAGKDKVFASLEELLANITPTTTATKVTVTLTKEPIADIYVSGTYRNGIYLNVPYQGSTKKIEIYSRNVPAEWVVGGSVSGTLTNCDWKDYNGTWELCPADWSELTYQEPKAVSEVVVSGTPTKTTYVDGEAFDPAGLTVTVNYNDATTEVNPAGVTFEVTPTTLTKGETAVSVTATFNSVTSEAYTVNNLIVTDIQSMTILDFITSGGTRCYLEGIVSGLTEGNSMKYGNFDLTDVSGTIYVYGCLNASGEKEKFAELGVKNGDKIKVIADELTVYNSKDQAKDVQYVSHISAATITIADITMEVGETKTIAATVVPAEAEVTYTIKENAANAISLSGNTITALAEGTATITATVAEGATYLSNSVDFTVTVKPQNIAELPFEFTRGKADIENTLGMSQEGLGSDYTTAGVTTKLKFDGTGDWVIIHFNGQAEKLVYEIKGNGFSGGKFTVQQSSDGSAYTDVVTYTELGDAATKEHELAAESRYVKFIYTEKSSGNVGLGNINITKLDDTSDTPDPIPGYNPVANPTTLSGVFSVAADKKVQFSTGNLQCEVGTNTNTWSFASKQYEVIGGAPYDPANPTNTNYGMNVRGYTGKLDLFAWSCDGKYGVNPSNTDNDYQGTFVDWGRLAGEGWFTLTKEEMNYILNRTKNGKKLWALATIDDLPGLILLPDNWNTNITLNYGYIPTQFVYKENLFTAKEWQILEVAGAVFLPAAGSRTGGYGNKDNAGFKESYDANGDYFHVDNVGIYGYYWLNTQDPRPNFQHCASYLILPGWDEGPTVDEEGLDDLSTHPQVWSREKRRGNSVRLVKTVEEEPKMTVSGVWELVTDVNSLAAGDKVVIVAKESNYALSTTQNSNNRGQAEVTKHSDKTISFTEEVQVLTLEAGTVENTFAFNTGNGYLYAASSSSNHLKTQNINNDNGIWKITITDGTASIVAQGTNTRNTMQYNQTSSLFACYASASQQAICLYRKKKVKVDNNQEATTNDIPNYSDVTVGSTGQLNVDEPLIVENLYIQTTMGAATSGQISNATNTNLLINGDVFIDITLGKNGDPNQWHAFTVPFPVDAMNGVYDIDDNQLKNEVNYAIMDYHGDLRANGQYGWKKYRGILVPGTFYLMTVDGERTTYRFKKVKDAAIVAPTTKAITAYNGTGDETKDKGWNGVGNPTLMHGKVEYDAQILDPESYTYVLVPASSAHFFTVGTPFFIQAATDGTMTIAAETSSSLAPAPARRAAAAVENIKVMLGNSDYTDRLYVSASEDATNEYEIGKDLGKMAMTSTPSVVQISALAYDTRLCMIDAPMTNNEALVALNLYAPANGEYTLSIEAQDNEKVYLLHDGTFVWDLSMSEYPITLNKGDNAGYSILVHRADAPTSVETIDGTNNQTEKLIHNGNLYILHNGKVFDAVGTMLK